MDVLVVVGVVVLVGAVVVAWPGTSGERRVLNAMDAQDRDPAIRWIAFLVVPIVCGVGVSALLSWGSADSAAGALGKIWVRGGDLPVAAATTFAVAMIRERPAGASLALAVASAVLSLFVLYAAVLIALVAAPGGLS
jgi:hypothetical protein